MAAFACPGEPPTCLDGYSGCWNSRGRRRFAGRHGASQRRADVVADEHTESPVPPTTAGGDGPAAAAGGNGPGSGAAAELGIRYKSPAGRWVLLATILGSGIAFLDATVVNVALPTIGRELHAGLASLQWTVNAYTLTLAGFLLLGGSLGDHYGRRKVFVIGGVWFAAASLLCGLAPTDEALIAARALQGVGGALLTPGSLAIIEASF